MTNRVPPRAPLSTLPAAVRLQLALPARPPYLALRPSSACTAPSSPHHARPPSGLLRTLSRSPTEARHHHRGPPLPAGMRAAVHTRDTCRHQTSCDGACAQPTSPLCGLGRRVRHMWPRKSVSIEAPGAPPARRAARAGPEHATCSPVYSPRTPHRPLRSDTAAQQALQVARSRSSLSSVQPS